MIRIDPSARASAGGLRKNPRVAGPTRTDVRIRGPLTALLALVLAGCAPTADPDVPAGTDFTTSTRADLVVSLVDAAGAPLDGWVLLGDTGRDAESIDGEARFLAVRSGDYELTARAPGHLDGGPLVVSVDESADEDLTVSLTLLPAPQLGGLSGLLLTPGLENPVEGASVLLDGELVANTEADGRFSATDIPPGEHEVRFEAPEGSSLLPWTTIVTIAAGEQALVSTVLPGGPPEGARYAGSGACDNCHAGHVGAWKASAHGSARSTVPVFVDAGPPALSDAFLSGSSVTIADGQVLLAASGPFAWTAEVVDSSGATTGPMPIVELYGGHLAGYAVAAILDEQRVLLPIGWAFGPDEPTAADPAPGWVEAWSAGWFSGGALQSPPASSASFDLSCAGCHTTAYSVAEDAAGWSLAPSGDANGYENQVGCEACHGPAGDHPTAPPGERQTRVYQPSRDHASNRNAVCSRCHQRVDSDLHPLSAPPGPPLNDRAELPSAWQPATDAGVAAPDRFGLVAASRSHRDQVGDFEGSPHRDAYLGACADCHDAHGSVHAGSLRTDPRDNALCTSCHGSDFPDEQAEMDHAAHIEWAPLTGGPGACVDCHLARSGVVVQRDAVSGVGETRDHGLRLWTPDDVLAAFDAAGVDQLPIADVPVNACLDCHLRAQARAEDLGGDCGCRQGDPTLRATWVEQAQMWADWEASR